MRWLVSVDLSCLFFCALDLAFLFFLSLSSGIDVGGSAAMMNFLDGFTAKRRDEERKQNKEDINYSIYPVKTNDSYTFKC